MSVLCKRDGCLVIMSTTEAAAGVGHCPICKGVEFRDSQHKWDHGWVECMTDGCDFAVLKKHLQRMPDDVANIIGAYI